jgi:integrase
MIGHAHRVLSKALKSAAKNELVTRNVAKEEAPPKVVDTDMVILHDVPSLVVKLPRTRRLHVPAMVALFTGMRLGEVLALRRNRIDLGAKIAQVREALEQTKTHGVRFKPPKSRAGRRDITLPDVLVDVLREHLKGQLELWMRLGAGRPPENALLFAGINGEPPSPNAVSAAWADFAESIGMPEVTFHALRHNAESRIMPSNLIVVLVQRTSVEGHSA